MIQSNLDHTKDGKAHYHVLVVLDRARLKNSFCPIHILKNHYCVPFEKKKDTWNSSVQAYVEYIQNKGPHVSYGDPSLLHVGHPDTKSKEILLKIQEGYKASTLHNQCPTMIPHISKLMCQRPPRRHETRCLHVWGPPGTGKTSTVTRVMRSIDQLYGLSTYNKVGGFAKYWDGYDNNEFIIIDDPAPFDMRCHPDEVALFKNVVSSEETIVEVKFGSRQFDSYLVIVLSNMSSCELADSAGLICRDAVMDRLTGSRAASHQECKVSTPYQAREKLPTYLIKVVARIVHHYFDLEFDVQAILDNMPPVDTLPGSSPEL